MPLSSDEFAKRVNPEVLAGGFSRRDGTREFYRRINALVEPHFTMLDYGAGRGAQVIAATKRDGSDLMFKGRVKRLVGCDIDQAVLGNPGLDEAVLIEPNQPLPFEDATFDLVFADWVLEHIEHPAGFAAEIGRILKPGGWFCARTPSVLSYIALAARIIPKRLQARVLKSAQSAREERDIFPKFYRINSPAAVRRAFPDAAFLNATYSYTPDPSYHGNRVWLYSLIDIYQALPMDMTKTTQHIFLQKK